MADASRIRRPAYYAAGSGGWRDWWTLLHPPYTAWHLAYVVVGACLAPRVHQDRLIATLLAFFGAVGIAAHALDELHGRPLGTRISRPVLVAVAVVGLLVALGLGVAGIVVVGWSLVAFLVVGPVLVVAYNLELFGGVLHSDAAFAFSWGAFPLLCAYVAQTGRVAVAPVLGCVAAFALSRAQRSLSNQARTIRRRAAHVEGSIVLSSGESLPIDMKMLLGPLETALRATSWAIVLLAAALAVAKMS